MKNDNMITVIETLAESIKTLKKNRENLIDLVSDKDRYITGLEKELADISAERLRMREALQQSQGDMAEMLSKEREAFHLLNSEKINLENQLTECNKTNRILANKLETKRTPLYPVKIQNIQD